MGINAKMSVNNNCFSATDGVSFSFVQSYGRVSSKGNLTFLRGNTGPLTIRLEEVKLAWTKPPLVGTFDAEFRDGEDSIEIYEDLGKTRRVTLGGSNEFGTPIVAADGKSITLSNQNSSKASYYYTLRIFVKEQRTAFVYDPVIRNEGPRTLGQDIFDLFFRELPLFFWRLIGFPFLKR